MNQIAVPTGNPGELFIPALGKKFQQVELREDDIYDTVRVLPGAVTAGTEYEFFRDIQNKNEQHTNLPQSRRIQAGDEVAVFRIGLYPRNKVGATHATSSDIAQIVDNAHFVLKFNRRIISDGPALKFPSGYGLSGASDLGAASAGNQFVSLGVPSVAAAPTLFVPQQLKDNDDIICKLRFPSASWVDNAAPAVSYNDPTIASVDGVLVSTFLRGVIKSPLGK
jgi:hypothetical protein